MIQISNAIWIGDSKDRTDLRLLMVNCIRGLFNVACDLQDVEYWDNIDRMRVGLIDGPGNTLAAYHAAILTLSAMLKRDARVMIYCHSGGRALAVATMYLHATGAFGLHPRTPTIMADLFSIKVGWQERLTTIGATTKGTLPKVHSAHGEAFDKIEWRQLVKLMVD